MSAASKIEWTDATYTPIRARRKDTGKVGVHCERVSAGCQNCYSQTFNRRTLPNQGTGLDFVRSSRDLVDIFVDEKILTQPLRWRSPKKVFVCSQTDLFAEFVTDEMRDQVFAVMALCPQHTFQVLTKRPERMREYVAAIVNDSSRYTNFVANGVRGVVRPFCPERLTDIPERWPLPNVWLGVSVEDQKNADARIPLLLDTPAAKRFVSYEPALGAVNFRRISALPIKVNALTGCNADFDGIPDSLNKKKFGYPSLDWVIVGGESGPGARPFNIEWARSTVTQCQASDVPVFVKQLGSNPKERNDRIADCWKYADGSDMDTREGPRDPEYQYQGGLVTPALNDRKGGDMAEWPEDLRVREFPGVTA